MQLELFHMPKTEIELIQDEQIAIKASMKNLRMGLFKRQTEHAKEISQLKAQNQELYCILKIIMKTMNEYYKIPQNFIQ